MLTVWGWSRVIENTHNIDNIVLELGEVFHNLITDTMDCGVAGAIKIKIEITKIEE